jgi:diaminopimelate epimerase
MGSPIFENQDFPQKTIQQSKARPCSVVVKVEGYEFNCVSMGNPHAVTFVKNLDKIDFESIGSKVETNSLFSNKINVEFVEKIDDTNYKVKVWERGCGETLACGTGACAVFSIINKIFTRTVLGKLGEETALEFPGGILYIREDKQGHIILRGPACFVFKGEIHI